MSKGIERSRVGIGIAGGVGPMAGVKLHELIIQQTLNSGTDQGHLPVIHISFPSEIPDRTEFLTGKTKNDPAQAMTNVMHIIETAAAVNGWEAISGVPCNTFHVPKIWDSFIKLLKKGNIGVQVLHMPRETAKLIKTLVPGAKNIGLMSTTGTREVDVYGQILRPRGFNILEVPWEMQEELHDSIYNPKWGIKGISPVSKKAHANFEKYAGILCNLGAQAIILGCTEIPLALPWSKYKDVPLIDPMLALARALIRAVDPIKLKPLGLALAA